MKIPTIAFGAAREVLNILRSAEKPLTVDEILNRRDGIEWKTLDAIDSLEAEGLIWIDRNNPGCYLADPTEGEAPPINRKQAMLLTYLAERDYLPTVEEMANVFTPGKFWRMRRDLLTLRRRGLINVTLEGMPPMQIQKETIQ